MCVCVGVCVQHLYGAVSVGGFEWYLSWRGICLVAGVVISWSKTLPLIVQALAYTVIVAN